MTHSNALPRPPRRSSAASGTLSSPNSNGRDEDHDDPTTASAEERVARMKMNEDRRSVAELYGGSGNGMRIEGWMRRLFFHWGESNGVF